MFKVFNFWKCQRHHIASKIKESLDQRLTGIIVGFSPACEFVLLSARRCSDPAQICGAPNQPFHHRNSYLTLKSQLLSASDFFHVQVHHSCVRTAQFVFPDFANLITMKKGKSRS